MVKYGIPFLDDIEIEIATTPAFLDDAVLWQAAPGRFLLDVPDVARYFVTNGRKVFIEPAANTDKEEVNRFLWMSPFAALLYQRGALAFHAAAAATPQGAVLLAGDSGAGKSTLLAALLKRGWAMAADDLAAVELNERGIPVVMPTFSEILLWPDAMEEMGIEGTSFPSFDDGKRKKILPLPSQCASNPMPLRAIYLRKAAAISGTTPILRLCRPRGVWSVEHLAERCSSNLQV